MFIDDMNMPQVDLQQPIALLKLLLEKGGMYDWSKDLNWKLFKDIVLVAAMGKVGTERRIHLTKFPKTCHGGSMTMSTYYARLLHENSGSIGKDLYWICRPLQYATPHSNEIVECALAE